MPYAILLVTVAWLAGDPGPFAIEVVDDATGRGVPLVELTTTGGITYVTDSAGLVAFDEPGLMHERVHFMVHSHGYEFRKDGFGFAGVALDVKPGGSAQIKIKRLNIAERLYRVTGQGIYRDSVLLGRETPLKQPLLTGRVIGLDSVNTLAYRGRLYWFWGDTNQPSYPLGNYHTTGATSPLPGAGQFDPERGVDLDYFVGDKGFARPVAEMPGKGPTWLGGVAVLPDASGTERLLTGYAKIDAPLAVYRRGIAQWNDEKETFEQQLDFAPDVPLHPDGHTFRHSEEDVEHLYFATSYPLVRVKAAAESYRALDEYEAYTCLQNGSRLDKPQIDRDEGGHVRYAWRKGTPAVTPEIQSRLVKEGLLKPHEGLLQLRDVVTGKPVQAHGGSSAAWNEYRQKWTNIVLQFFGSSLLGEIWYAEADTPVGPWVYASKVVTHNKYSFYNPLQHREFVRLGSQHLYFEGTYTHSFSGNEHRTPRYDYNQIMYRLDLGDERLVLPVALYDQHGKGVAADWKLGACETARAGRFDAITFFVLDRPRKSAVAVYRDDAGTFTTGAIAEQAPGATKPLFYALPADADEPGITVPLYEYLSDDGGPTMYDISDRREIPGYRLCPAPLCRVWPSPYRPQ
jgi:hypothetical protein